MGLRKIILIILLLLILILCVAAHPAQKTSKPNNRLGRQLMYNVIDLYFVGGDGEGPRNSVTYLPPTDTDKKTKGGTNDRAFRINHQSKSGRE